MVSIENNKIIYINVKDGEINMKNVWKLKYS